MKITIVSCTQVMWDRWHDTELGSSIRSIARISDKVNEEIYFENKRSLGACYNDVIDACDDDERIIFCHDDVRLRDPKILEKLEEGFETYDIIGLAGTASYTIASPCLWHRSNPEHMSGVVRHAHEGNEWDTNFGPARPCIIVDGLFIAIKNKAILKDIRFDPQFKFHHYDMDFCLSAHKAGLKIGTVPIDVTHYSVGDWRDDPTWFESEKLFMQKWKPC